MSIEKSGKQVGGRREWLKHNRGKKLTRMQAMKAKCYDCMGGYIDGRYSCEMPHEYPLATPKSHSRDTES